MVQSSALAVFVVVVVVVVVVVCFLTNPVTTSYSESLIELQMEEIEKGKAFYIKGEIR